MDRLEDMIAFVRVAESQSFTAAAERLGLSKSAVSRRMAELEDRLGVRLINRTTRRLGLTEVGQTFYERCQRIIADIEDAECSATRVAAEPRGILRVNAPTSFGIQHLGPALAAFMTRYPRIELVMDLNDRFVDLIEEGYDVALRIGRLRDSSLVARRLAVSRRVLCAAPAYLDQAGRPRQPEDLARHRCLIYTNVASPGHWTLIGPDGTVTQPVTGPMHSNNGDMLRELAIAGHGIATLPSFLVADALTDGRLEMVLPDHPPIEGALHAIFPHGRHLTTKVRVFVDFLARQFGPEPYWDSGLAAAREAAHARARPTVPAGPG